MHRRLAVSTLPAPGQDSRTRIRPATYRHRIRRHRRVLHHHLERPRPHRAPATTPVRRLRHRRSTAPHPSTSPSRRRCPSPRRGLGLVVMTLRRDDVLCTRPAFPTTCAVKLHVVSFSPFCNVTGTDGHVAPSRTSSRTRHPISDVNVTGSDDTDVFFTVTGTTTSPPGSGNVTVIRRLRHHDRRQPHPSTSPSRRRRPRRASPPRSCRRRRRRPSSTRRHCRRSRAGTSRCSRLPARSVCGSEQVPTPLRLVAPTGPAGSSVSVVIVTVVGRRVVVHDDVERDGPARLGDLGLPGRLRDRDAGRLARVRDRAGALRVAEADAHRPAARRVRHVVQRRRVRLGRLERARVDRDDRRPRRSRSPTACRGSSPRRRS